MSYIHVKKSEKTGNINKMVLPMSFAVFQEKYILFKKHGLPIHRAFPDLKEHEREFIQTGVTKQEKLNELLSST